MALKRGEMYTRRHLAEFLVLGLFSLVALNPLDLSLGFIYTGTTPEAIKASILELGGLAPVGMMLMEALQIVIAPLPPVTMVASGYTFGFIYGSIYSFLGMVAGSAAALLVSRRLGIPVVKSFVSENHIEKFQETAKGHGYLVIGAFFVAPGFPHDILCYVAGLTDLDLEKLIIIICIGRTPTLLALVMTGDSIASSRVMKAGLILALLTFIGFITVKQEERIFSAARKAEARLDLR
jgi:uncharacterized membrane protein YdjX (TVP38/TMEM64 family)